jgi:hypothetical protein
VVVIEPGTSVACWAEDQNDAGSGAIAVVPDLDDVAEDVAFAGSAVTVAILDELVALVGGETRRSLDLEVKFACERLPAASSAQPREGRPHRRQGRPETKGSPFR